ncbi:MAG: hypothetical protein R3B95_15650 [Nitrospirales bacterium]|nr:DUF86 domain-containing protein [Nitrospirales bacterium]
MGRHDRHAPPVGSPYFDIDLDILWKTAQEDLPPLIAELERVTSGDLS